MAGHLSSRHADVCRGNETGPTRSRGGHALSMHRWKKIMTDREITRDATFRLQTIFPVERNARRHAIRRTVGAMAIVAPLVIAVLLICLFGYNTASMLSSIVLLFVSIASLDMDFMPDYGTEPTPHLETARRDSLVEIVEGLTKVCSSGMHPSEHPKLQHQLDMFAQVLCDTFGKSAWLIAAEQGGVKRQAVPTSTREMGMRLAEFGSLGKELAEPHGMSKNRLRHHCVNLVPLIASVGREFGFDVSMYEPPVDSPTGRRHLPNPVRKEAPEIPVSRARVLAEQWIAGDRSQVDEQLRNDADAAAGRDLNQLEQAWIAACSAAPERQEEIDKSYNAAVDRLSSTLANALEARGRPPSTGSTHTSAT